MAFIVLIFLKPYPEAVGCVIREKGDHYTSLLGWPQKTFNIPK
jgi:hypothetical protein